MNRFFYSIVAFFATACVQLGDEHRVDESDDGQSGCDDPPHPAVLVACDGFANSVALDGGAAYWVVGSGTVCDSGTCPDLAVLTAPLEGGEAMLVKILDAAPTSIAVGALVYLPFPNRLEAFSIIAPDNVQVVDTQLATSLTVADGWVYWIGGNDGVLWRAFEADLSSKEEPAPGVQPLVIDGASGLVAWLTIDGSLYFLRPGSSQPELHSRLERVRLDAAAKLYVSTDHFVVQDTTGVHVGNWASKIIRELPIEHVNSAAIFDDDFVYITGDQGSLRIIDITTFSEKVLVEYPEIGSAKNLTFAGGTAVWNDPRIVALTVSRE